jgi:hypothetical protein
MGDYAIWLQCYRDFIGDPLAPPPGPKPVELQKEAKPSFSSMSSQSIGTSR